MDLDCEGCGKCLTWPCTCDGEERALSCLRELRTSGVTMVSVKNPRRPTRTHFFTLGPAEVVHSLDVSDAVGPERRRGRELTSINGVPIDQWRRENG